MAGTTTATPETKAGWSRRRRIAFYVAVGLSLASMAVTGPFLTLPVAAWLPSDILETLLGEENLGAHRVHIEGAGLLFWLTIIAMVSQIRLPHQNAAPLWAAATAWVVFLPIELTHLVDPFSIVVTALVVTVLALHPRRRPPGALQWRTAPRLVAVPAAALGLFYAYQQAVLQLDGFPQDPHVSGSHYALMAALAVGLSASALIGATRLPGHRVAAWTAASMSIVLGIFFIGHPHQTSSVDTGWAVALIVWGVVFTLASRPDLPASDPSHTAPVR